MIGIVQFKRINRDDIEIPTGLKGVVKWVTKSLMHKELY